jgi:uncharacterized protein (TIGR03083 family)
MTTELAVSTKNPRKAALDREVAMTLAATEYERVVAVLEKLTPSQWTAQTDCTNWDVRAMAGHVLGMTQMAATMRETIRQQVASKKRAKKDGGLMIDAMTAGQVDKNVGLSTDDLVRAMRLVGPKAARGRRRTPGFVRNRTMGDVQVVGGEQEWWTLGYLLDIILTRDPFMHRVDIAQATGVPMQATAGHEGVIIDDVVREWAARHGKAYCLELTGPAGGRWQQGEAEHVTADAFEFCRMISGRAPATGLFATQVPF